MDQNDIDRWLGWDMVIAYVVTIAFVVGALGLLGWGIVWAARKLL